MMPRSSIASLIEQAKSKDAKSVACQSSPTNGMKSSNRKSKPNVRESKEKVLLPDFYSA
jgi:hypothetical protein